jgi:hypothetical protein
VARAEAEEERGRAIHRYLSRAFNEPSDGAGGAGDSNPLTRRNRLTAFNPLLD